MTTNDGQTTSLPALRESEWVFSEHHLPNWQKRFCANYEYARECAAFQTAVQKTRLDKMWRHNQTCWALKHFLARWVPEYPATPWQEIDLKRRTKLLRIIEVSENTTEYGFRDFGHPQAYCEAIMVPRILGCFDENTSFVLEFNFRETDTYIERGFSAWLKAKRKELLAWDSRPTSPYRASKNRRGHSNISRQCDQALNSLSIYRTFRHRHQSLKHQDPEKIRLHRRAAEKIIQRFADVSGTSFMGFII